MGCIESDNMNWKSFLPRRRVVIRPLTSSQMRLRDWRASPELVASAQKLFALPEFRTMLSILHNESPSSYGLALGATHDDQIAHAYKSAGYALALNNLEALATIDKRLTPLESTFEPEQPPLRSEAF